MENAQRRGAPGAQGSLDAVEKLHSGVGSGFSIGYIRSITIS